MRQRRKTNFLDLCPYKSKQKNTYRCQNTFTQLTATSASGLLPISLFHIQKHSCLLTTELLTQFTNTLQPMNPVFVAFQSDISLNAFITFEMAKLISNLFGERLKRRCDASRSNKLHTEKCDNTAFRINGVRCHAVVDLLLVCLNYRVVVFYSTEFTHTHTDSCPTRTLLFLTSSHGEQNPHMLDFVTVYLCQTKEFTSRR